ncbi:MAG TPA: HEAT repeat domain-containing protein, partial [Myxococcales bacterium]
MSDWRSQRDQALSVLDREKRRETRIDAAHVLRDLAREQRQSPSEFRSAIDCLLGDSEPEVRRTGL